MDRFDCIGYISMKLEREVEGRGGLIPEASHILLALWFALGFIAARFLLDVFVFKPFAAILLGQRTAKDKDDEARQSKILKCSESMWKLTYSVSVQLWAVWIMIQDPWWMDTKEYFKEWQNQEIESSLKLFSTCQCGFYMYSIVALLTWETQRKDFPIMMSHHIITLVMIESSFLLRLLRIGTITLAMHDTSDVFLEAGKIFKYTKKETGAGVCSGLFAVSWLILRLVIFPFWIIKAMSYDLLLVVDDFPWSLYYAFNTMLITLLTFHMYWWKLICVMIWKQIRN